MIQTTWYILGEFKCPPVGKKLFSLFLTDIFLLFWSLNYAMFILFLCRVVLFLKATERNSVHSEISLLASIYPLFYYLFQFVNTIIYTVVTRLVYTQKKNARKSASKILKRTGYFCTFPSKLYNKSQHFAHSYSV